MRIAALLLAAVSVLAADDTLAERLKGLRATPDSARAAATRRLALDIRALPAGPEKLRLAYSLANLSTEGDFGRQTLQEVAATLAGALRETAAGKEGPYRTLAQLIRYEGVEVEFDAPQLAAALARLEEQDRRRAEADFALRDLNGKEWKLSELRGKVALINFWATWCPPCRKEIPTLESLRSRFGKKGLVILGVSDEDAAKLEKFAKERKVKYPLLRDPDGKVAELFGVEGIPKSFVYDRGGKLVATAIDMRTMDQFLAMLAKAGLR